MMQFLDFNFVTMFYIRKIKDEHQIISSATNKEVGFSSEQHFSCARIFVKIEIDRPLTYCIFTAFECYFFVLWSIFTNSKRKCYVVHLPACPRNHYETVWNNWIIFVLMLFLTLWWFLIFSNCVHWSGEKHGTWVTWINFFD